MLKVSKMDSMISNGNLVDNVAKVAALFPECCDAKGGIDFAKLRLLLGDDNATIGSERYELSWAGKTDAFRTLLEGNVQTLAPDREQSVNFDTTENIFIEGENLEVLKVLQKSYFGKVKMIYIDPPYNTGSDSFIYPDKFAETKEEYMRRVGDKGEDGYMTREGLFRKNSKENGQYHSNWLSMMLPRLYLAKNLMCDAGVIFVSIDDNEVHNLRLVMNEVFGEENFVAQITIANNPRGRQSDRFFATCHEYLICYTKNEALLEIGGTPLTAEQKGEYKFEDDVGRYRLLGLRQRGAASLRSDRPDMFFPFYVNPKTHEVSIKEIRDWEIVFPRKSDGRDGRWMWGKTKCEKDVNRLVAKRIAKRSEFDIFVKDYLMGADSEERVRKAKTVWDDKNINNQIGTQEVKALIGGDYMSFPKSSEYIKKICSLVLDKDAIILDFFAGSGTTAHAVMQLNAEDGGKRRFICIQLPEVCDTDSEAAKAGYQTIADISRERIRRAAKKIGEEVAAKQADVKSQLALGDVTNATMPDLGFKAFKLQSSNFKEWRKIAGDNIGKLTEQMLSFVDPVSETATVDNMVYELLLRSGKSLNSKIERRGKWFLVNDGELVLMLEEATREIVDEVISVKPQKVVALDRIFSGNDQLKTNTALQLRDAGVEFKTI